MWVFKILGLLSVVIAVGMLGTAIARLMKRRTIAAWSGRGINDTLVPIEAALLLGLHPGPILALSYEHLSRLGIVTFIDEKPVRLEWCGTEPTDELERAFKDTIGPEGRMIPDRVHAFLDTLYDRVNEKMLPYSGTASANYHERKAKTLWRQMKESGHPEPAIYPWLLLLDGTEIWGDMGTGEDWEELKAMHRSKERFRTELNAMGELSESARRAKKGFFRYRKDFVRAQPRVMEKDVAQRLTHG